MRTSPESVAEFFDRISGHYTEAIERCVPRYREMLWALLYYLPEPPWQPRRILELGCGTGNLSLLLRDRFPAAELELVDVSGEVIERCRARLGDVTGVTFHQVDFRDLALPEGHLDLVISSISLHHLEDADKRDLFRRAHGWLGNDGIITYSDQFAGQTPELYAKHLAEWERQSRALGATDEEWSDWMVHQQAADHHAPLPAQLDWLKEAGFEDVDCPWRHLLWTIVRGRRGTTA